MNGQIEVADGAIPRWWVVAFFTVLTVAAGYWLWFEAFHVSPGPLDRYIAARAAALDTGEPVTEEALTALTSDKLALRGGSRAFEQNCAKCHGQRGEGGIGPNLTDDHWIEGGAALEIYQTIALGRTGKGMPAWGLQLGPGLCKQLAAHVLTIRGTHASGGKPPQGERWEPGPDQR